MTLALHTIKKPQGAAKKRKRVGRGNSSGHGTYSGRGIKGQKSRSGVSNLKRLGMRQVLLRTPKKRGFKSIHPKEDVVNLVDINKNYQAGESVSMSSLKKKGLIKKTSPGVKILANGTLTVSGLVFKGLKMSAAARKAIESAGGKIEE
ncbi:50S ribosomal protein L15 [Candidatus Parcubacteria bacterium]|nr:MAG: 50S ribosomal protein L15 [Candidatus Parcubacteria bacterium]